MKVSEYYHIALKQSSLEFVDVDTYSDTKVYIDPKALKDIDSPWAHECVALLQTFFSAVLRAIQNEDKTKALGLLSHLNEPNETRLGVSKNRASGRAVGTELSTDIWEALTESAAATSGLLEDLEDTALLIEHIGFDLVSDMTTNIIRSQLIEFTHRMCEKYPTIVKEDEVYPGPVWDRRSEKWTTNYTDLPVADGRVLILVPKSIVRRNKLTFDPGEYMAQYILPKLVSDELSNNSSLIHVLKSGEHRVYKNAVRKKHGIEKQSKDDLSPVRPSKTLSLEVTLEHPEILDDYRAAKNQPTPPLTNNDLSELTGSEPPDWDKLLNDVVTIEPGRPNATKYHLAVEALFSALFFPALDYMKHEYKLDPTGRKRVDITYTNIARDGFFDWVNRVVGAPAHEVYIECKNYAKDVGNPELDQIRGRFSDLRSNLGFMVFRSTSDKQRIIEGCKDTAHGGHGFIIALDDNDLRLLVEERKQNEQNIIFQFLRNRYAELVS
jgi:hypothetical protein